METLWAFIHENGFMWKDKVTMDYLSHSFEFTS